MNQVLSIKFVKEVNDRVYSFDLPVGAPFGEAYDVCHEVLQMVTKMASDAAEKSAQKSPAVPAPEVAASDASVELM